MDDAPAPEAGNRDVEERTEPVGGAPATRAREAKESRLQSYMKNQVLA